MAMSRSEYRDAVEKTKALARQENNKRKRILVVEDDRISLALLRQLLVLLSHKTQDQVFEIDSILKMS